VLWAVLSVAAGLLSIASWGAIRLSLEVRASQALWDRVVIDFAAVEVVGGARRAGAQVGREIVGTILTANRSQGRWVLEAITPWVWRVRWGVGDAAGRWREGHWLAVAKAAGAPMVEATDTVSLVPVPSLPPVP